MNFIRSRGRREEDLEQEIQDHLRRAERDRIDRGQDPEQARFAVRREFGNVDMVKESVRRAWGHVWLDRLLQDIRYGMRMIRRNPGFSAAVLITLALGIGANTAIFNILDTVDLRPLPVRNPQELVLLKPLQNGSEVPVLSYPIIREMNSKQNMVQGIFASGSLDILSARVDGRDPIESVDGRLVTGNYFRLLGADARLGRGLADGDAQPSAAGVAVVSDRFWRREFGGRADAIGRSLIINGALLSVVGVMPPEFFGETIGKAPDFWAPMNMAVRLRTEWSLSPGVGWLSPMARLRPDVSPQAAQAALSALYGELHHLTLSIRGATNFRIELDPISQGQNQLEEFTKPLRLLMATAGLVILIACCNLASLFLARSAARTHEIGVRVATGASRGRLVRQLMTESLLFSAVGGATGFAIGVWGSRGLALLATAGRPLRISTNLDWRIAAFTALMTIAAACLFGLAPALDFTGPDCRSFSAGPIFLEYPVSGLGLPQGGHACSEFCIRYSDDTYSNVSCFSGGDSATPEFIARGCVCRSRERRPSERN
jgi:predicted permease